jgi:Reverse transcriptase (RNA-dependent DNA polymerase)
MCIHTVKPDTQGQPDRDKSRTVVLGNEEHRYWEKTDLFAPVISKHSVRTLIGYAVFKGRTVQQCDAKNAFCHPTLLDDEVCIVHPPKGRPFSAPGTYWRLKKTLYRLRRSPRHWYQTFSSVLQEIGLKKCPHEPCLFIGKTPTGGTIYFGIYVDDCTYFGTDDESERWFESQLGSCLKIDFMGPLSYYLGVHYVWGRTLDGGLTVNCSQAGHIYKMLEKHGMESPDSHHLVKTPFRSGIVIDSLPHDGINPKHKPMLVTQFQSIVGGLNWLSTSTCPDITAVTSLLASHLPNPSRGHVDSAKHVLQYLKGTPTWGLCYTQPTHSPVMRIQMALPPLILKGV